jgi:Flp pilus assembly protein TadG
MRGQSLAEFAISSVVLVLLFGGLVDLTRAIHYADVLQSAARQGVRTGSAFDNGKSTETNPRPGNSYLDDSDIQAAVNAQLVAGGLPASILRTPGTCPGNSFHNPPYASGAFPTTANQPWLYICYPDSVDHPDPTNPGSTLPGDLNVVLLMSYGPMTASVPTPLGGVLGLAANLRMRIQGG